MNRLQFLGFNNLTKSLSFNIYDICYANSEEQQRKYIEYIDESYNANRLTQILTDVTAIIGAEVLNIARKDYEPQGASVTMLISEGDELPSVNNTETPGPVGVVGHLSTSHITVHTYPEMHPYNGLSTFRADIDVSTCGRISPLKALNYLIHSFESDIVIMDYRVRGFTRDISGQKHYIDHEITSIQNYIAGAVIDRYHLIDVNVYQENIFHTKMLLKDFKLDNYLFNTDKDAFDPDQRIGIEKQLKQEMSEIFYGRNYRLRR